MKKISRRKALNILLTGTTTLAASQILSACKRASDTLVPPGKNNPTNTPFSPGTVEPAATESSPAATQAPVDYADLVVARAGAISVSELQLVQLPAILVPLPTAAEDHQTMNARALTDRGAAVLVKDDDAVQLLGKEIVRLIEDEGALMKLRSTIAGLGQQNAAEAIAVEVIRLARS